MFFLNLRYKFLTILSRIFDKLSKLVIWINYEKVRSNNIESIHRIDSNLVEDVFDEVRLFAVMRNESLRLPYFINYYRSLGMDRFFLIDNNSSDNSVEYLKNEERVHLFSTTASYDNHWYWIEHLLETYGKGYWCMVVDIDELFYYPNKKDLPLRDLCKFLDSKGETAVCSLLLDMYPVDSVSGTSYDQGQNPIDVVSYFDAHYFSQPFLFLDRKTANYFTATIFSGGMRDIVFGKSNPPSILSKMPLFKYLAETYLVQGMHAINNAGISNIQGVVFHTKFLSDFIPEVKEECEREQHYGGAFYYKIFNKKLEENPDISFHYEGSLKFKDSQQLLDLGMMKTTPEFEAYVEQTLAKNEKS